MRLQILAITAAAAMVALVVACGDQRAIPADDPDPPKPPDLASCVTSPPEISFSSPEAMVGAIDVVSGETAYAVMTVTSRSPVGSVGCPPTTYYVDRSDRDDPYGSEVEVDWPAGRRVDLASGESAGLPVTILPVPDYEDPGTASGYAVWLAIRDTRGVALAERPVFVRLTHLAAGCAVSRSRELMIVDPSVVNDVQRTTGRGAWSIAGLMEQIAPSPDLAPGMFDRAIRSMAELYIINSFVIAGRAAVGELADAWPRLADGRLDLERVPVRLQAIVPRVDLRDVDPPAPRSSGAAGWRAPSDLPASTASGAVGRGGRAGRINFVFGFLDTRGDAHGTPIDFTLILEYDMPARSEEEVRRWADRVHALGDLRFGEEYNAALQGLTDRVTLGGSYAGRPGDSALVAMRTSEGLAGVRELREFRISSETKFLEPVAVEGTPDTSYVNNPVLASFVGDHAAELRAGRGVEVPLDAPGHPGIPFRAGTSKSGWDLRWLGGVAGVDGAARDAFAVGTCNGCHGLETLTAGAHIRPRGALDPAALSPFLDGVDPQDSGEANRRHHDDVDRRVRDLERLVCAGPDGPSPAALRRGVERTH